MSGRLRFVDLFAGVGGFHQALSSEEFDGECVLAVEIDEKCRQTYLANWPHMSDRIRSDIRELTTGPNGELTPAEIRDRGEIPDHEVLCAGFPCQPFSKSGFQEGVLDETRGTLFHDITLIARAKKPRYIILENVRNLAGPRHTETWDTIIRALRGAGYRVADEPVVLSPHLLPRQAGGSPQVRDRVFILATHVGLGHDPDHYVEEPLLQRKPDAHWDPDDWSIDEFLDADSEIRNLETYRLRPDEEMWIEAWNAFAQAIDGQLPGHPLWAFAFTTDPGDLSGLPPWKADFLRKNSDFYRQNKKAVDRWLRTRWTLPGSRTKFSWSDFPHSRQKFEWQARKHQQPGERDLWDLLIQLRPSGIRVKPPTYLPALVAITQTSIIGSRRRRITPAEAARLQGMDPAHLLRAEHDDAVVYKQLGNAVNVGVVQHALRALLDNRIEERAAA